MSKKVSQILFAGTLSLSLSAEAFERDHDAHVHGHANLMVVVEKNELQIALRSPAMNIVGFEHKPSSHKDEERVEDAVSQLKKANTLFALPSAAGCALEKVHIESELMDREVTDSDGHHDHHKEHHEEKDHDDHHDDHHDEHHREKHAGHHDHSKHDEHKSHDHHEGHDEVHSEFEAEYHYECSDIAKLDSLDLSLFKVFSKMEEIEAQIVGPKGQTLLELSPSMTRVSF